VTADTERIPLAPDSVAGGNGRGWRVLFLAGWPDRSERALMAELQRRGVRVTSVCDVAAQGRDELVAAGVRVLSAPCRRAGGEVARTIAGAVDEDRPHVVHVLASRLLRVLVDVVPAERRPPIVLYRGRIERPRRWIPADRAKYLSGRVARFVANSQAVARAMLDGGVPPERVRVVLKGHDAAWYRVPPADLRGELGIARDVFLIGTVANFRREKGSGEILPAARLLRARGLRVAWVLVGQDERPSLVRRLRPLAEPGLVFPIGWRADVPALLPAFDCLVNPSRTEGMAKAVIEAMFREVPVIATAVGGMPEVIADGRTGLLVPSRSPRATADAVERLIGDPALRRSLASAAREWVETHLSVAVAADRILDAYRETRRGT
jgi:glycosyltransferase involved in cell wall biosynthesis